MIGAVIALGVPLVGVAFALRRTRLEGKQEAAILDRRLRVPIAKISELDPTGIGVDPAAQDILSGGDVPAYVPRAADSELGAAIEAAFRGGRWLIVLHGPSKVGKSRTLFHALLHCSKASSLSLIAPVDAHALRSLATPGETINRSTDHVVLWLDDLEPFLSDGLNWRALMEWRDRSSPGAIVVATYGGKGSEVAAQASSRAPSTIADDVLQHAAQIGLTSSSSTEIDPLRLRLAPHTLQSIEIHGLAAYLVAGPALERKLSTRRHALGDPECPAGAAIVYAAVDWARCGRTDPIEKKALRQLWPAYLPGVDASDTEFAAGLAWALQPVAGTIALLQAVAGYRAYDYIARLVTQRTESPAPPDVAWRASDFPCRRVNRVDGLRSGS